MIVGLVACHCRQAETPARECEHLAELAQQMGVVFSASGCLAGMQQLRSERGEEVLRAQLDCLLDSKTSSMAMRCDWKLLDAAAPAFNAVRVRDEAVYFRDFEAAKVVDVEHGEGQGISSLERVLHDASEKLKGKAVISANAETRFRLLKRVALSCGRAGIAILGLNDARDDKVRWVTDGARGSHWMNKHMPMTLVVTEHGLSIIQAATTRDVPKIDHAYHYCHAGRSDPIDDDCDKDSLVGALRHMKAEDPDQTYIAVQVENAIRFDELVRIIDLLQLKRNGYWYYFPDVLISPLG
jgi:hypothetical protein